MRRSLLAVFVAAALALPAEAQQTLPPRTSSGTGTSTEALNRRSVFRRDSTGALSVDTVGRARVRGPGDLPPATSRPVGPAPGRFGVASPTAGTTETVRGVVMRYRQAYELREAERRLGGGLVPAEIRSRPPSDSVSAELLRAASLADLPIVVEPLPPAFVVSKVEGVPPAGRLSFRNRFRATRYAYVGTRYASRLDTTQTWRLRAALQGRHGPPTQTIADLGSDVRLGPGTSFMFEYWFVVNDTIPVIVTDAGSPTERGLVIGTPARLRLPEDAVKEALFAALTTAPLRPFADYRYLPDTRTWEIVGYDGVRFVRRAIPRPDVRTVGRPSVSMLAGPR